MDIKKTHTTLEAIAAVLLVMFFLSKDKIFVLAALVLLFIAAVWPKGAEIIFKIWETITKFLAKIIGGLCLTIVFYIILTPLALLQRLLGKTLSQAFFSKAQETYYSTYQRKTDKSFFEKLWLLA